MNKLTTQILKRQKYVEQQNEKQLAYENMEISDGKHSIEATQQQKKNDKERAKKHWEDELQRT